MGGFIATETSGRGQRVWSCDWCEQDSYHMWQHISARSSTGGECFGQDLLDRSDGRWMNGQERQHTCSCNHTHTHTLINIHVMSPDEYVQCVSLQRPLLVRKLPIMHWANDRWYSRFPGLRVWLTNNFISPLVSLSPAWGSERAIMTLLHHHEEFVCCCLCLVIIETAWRTTQTASVSVPQQPSINIKTYSTCVTVSGAANLMNINNWP